MSIETIIVQVEQPTVVVRTGVPGPEGPPGTAEGDVAGPAASIDGELPVFDGTTGKRLKRGTYTLATLLATARDRATHTGTQLAATISDFAAAVGALLSWSAISGKPTTFDPTAHKSSHATGGSDALTASDIGAAAASHTHALSALTASGASTGQVPVWNGSAWVATTLASGGSPGGSGAELQYRSGSSTFGAVAGSHYDPVTGRVAIGAGTSPAAVMHLAADSASEPVLCLDMASSATAYPFQLRAAGGQERISITPAGMIRVLGSGGSGTYGMEVYTDNGSTLYGRLRTLAVAGQACMTLESQYSIALVLAAGNFVILSNLPTSATGLPTGALYDDAGTIKRK